MRKVEQVHFQNSALPKPKNVAAYARVSCGKDEMLHSLAAQVEYYKSLITSHNGWQFCGVCGCRYMRKKNHGNYIWRCNAYNLDGLEACTSKQIPDSILHRLADECDKPIKKIFIMPENSVKFIFADNTETTLKWTNPSHRDSWTPEMREAARKKALERRRVQCQEQ
ncbi:MAG: recombinase zinc beta ribbon domain-containing protein [Clostridia bacterium]|nr:recombinase zinc beta ribbon domain-containing protein [Clostridia bacterium]